MMLLTRPTLWTLFMGCAIGVVLANNTGNANETVLTNKTGKPKEKLFDVFKEVGKDITGTTSDNLKKTTRASGRVVTSTINLVGSGVNLGINELADNINRTERILSMIPQYSKDVKDNVIDLGTSAVDLGFNQLKKVKTLGKVTFRAIDSVTDSAANETGRIINGTGVLLQSTAQAIGNVGVNMGEGQGQTISDMADVFIGLKPVKTFFPNSIPSPCKRFYKVAKKATIACQPW